MYTYIATVATVALRPADLLVEGAGGEVHQWGGLDMMVDQVRTG